MARALQIEIEPPRTMSSDAELTLLRHAIQENPAASILHRNLAMRLNEADQFDQTIDLLTSSGSPMLDFERCVLLTNAYFSRRTIQDDTRALDTARRAVSLAHSAAERARAMADEAKAYLRQGLEANALILLKEALDIEPHSVPAFKRLSVQLLRMEQFEEVESLTTKMLAQGVCHARVLGARMLALAALERIDEAQALAGHDAFLFQQKIDLPEGWESLADFNAAIAAEILANPDIRYNRFGIASHETWRVDSPSSEATPAVNALLGQIVKQTTAYIDLLGKSDHPWIKACPDRLVFRCWSVITGAEGLEQWHMHPFGWLSGGYYVDVPKSVCEGDGVAGCLSLGLPGGMIGQQAAEAFGTMIVRPYPGLLTLFPSHSYHQTHPHGSDERRICLAFDLGPG